MPRKMVDPTGKVWNIDDSEIALARSKGAVDFGSPEHMALIGTSAPGAGTSMPDTSNVMQEDSKLQQYVRGAGRGIIHSAHGAFTMVPQRFYSPESQRGLANMAEMATPEGTAEKVGKTSEQAAEFLIPMGAGRSAAKAVQVGERVMQTRNAAGQFLKATRSPVVRDLVARAAAKVGTEALATGTLNKVQGGDFNTGAVAGGAAAALPYGVAPVQRMVARGLQNPMVRRALPHALGYGTIAGLASGKLDPYTLGKAALIASFAHPVGAAVLGRAAVAGGLQFDRMSPGDKQRVRMKVGSNSEYMGGDGHENIGP